MDVTGESVGADAVFASEVTDDCRERGDVESMWRRWMRVDADSLLMKRTGRLRQHGEIQRLDTDFLHSALEGSGRSCVQASRSLAPSLSPKRCVK